MKTITPEFIHSLTPIFIATIGGIIGIAVLFSRNRPRGVRT
jgi:hypothetical protein